MLLKSMELSGEELGDPNGLRSGELTFVMKFVATDEHEIPAMMREFNEGQPTLAFWEGIEYGHVPAGSVEQSPIAVSLKQAGSPAARTTLAMKPGTRHLIGIPVTVIGPDGSPLGGMVQIEVDTRLC